MWFIRKTSRDLYEQSGPLSYVLGRPSPRAALWNDRAIVEPVDQALHRAAMIALRPLWVVPVDRARPGIKECVFGVFGNIVTGSKWNLVPVRLRCHAPELVDVGFAVRDDDVNWRGNHVNVVGI
jgi:hypothetical protein